MNGPDPEALVRAFLTFIHEMPMWADMLMWILCAGLIVRFIVVPIIRAKKGT